MIYRYFLLALLLFSACSNNREKEDKTIKFTAIYEKVNETTGDENIENSWLIRPGKMAVDHNGYLYVTDEKRNFIQKFDAELNFIQTIGKEGRGPGEFNNIGDIIADSVLLGYSYRTQRINKFRLDGTFIASYTVEETAINTKIIRTGNGFILAYMPYTQNRDDFFGIHNYSNEFEKRGKPQLHASEIYPDFNKLLYHQAKIDYGNIFPINDRRIIIAPITYLGELYEYVFNPATGNWTKNKTIQGVEIEKAYSKLPGRDNYDLLIFKPGNDEPSAFRLHGKSLFLTQLSSGQFVHFIHRDSGEKRQFGIELFDENLNYMGFEVFLTDLDAFDDDRIFLYTPRAKNDQDIFYSIEFDDQSTRLVARKLEIDIE